MQRFRNVLRSIVSFNLQGRLIVGFLTAACITGIVATIVGMHLINKNTISEVHRKVEQNIKTAQLIYDHSMEQLASRIQLVALRLQLSGSIESGGITDFDNISIPLVREDRRFHVFEPIDMLAVVDATGRVVHGFTNHQFRGEDLSRDPLVRLCLEEGISRTSTELLPLSRILSENPKLSERITIPIVSTPQSVKVDRGHLSEAMVMRAVVPVMNADGNLAGAVIGAILLNNDAGIVDRIKETIYGGERYGNLEMGFATIFQGGIRISTNVLTDDKQRAVGTIVSEEVYRTVIEQGRQWIGRAFVLDDWYISSYVPLRSPDDAIIGMLYTGILEAKYRDMKRSSMLIFLGITALGVVVAFLVSWRLGNTIIERIRLLKEATDAIASGNLEYRVRINSLSGLDMLDEAFNNMTESLKDRDERLRKVFHQLTKTERLAALGQIAAGVAHEINNPLGGILLYSNLVLEELPEDSSQQRNNIEKIIYQANRCRDIVQNLLDFSRSPSGRLVPCDINRVILTSLNLVKDQSMFLGIAVETDLADNLPQLLGDQSRLEQVFLNLLVNAADAMEGAGTLSIKTKLINRYLHDDHSVDGMETEKVCLLTSTNTVKITVNDTGKGIDEPYLPHIFEPFFSTKEPGKGTGLGLSITYGIIKKHNGFIDVESIPGEGTTITMYLPACDGTSNIPSSGIVNSQPG